MGNHERADGRIGATSRWLPYALAGIGLPVGLLVVLLQPFAWPALNYLVGGAALAAVGGSVTFLIVRHSGPDERGPDF